MPLKDTWYFFADYLPTVIAQNWNDFLDAIDSAISGSANCELIFDGGSSSIHQTDSVNLNGGNSL